MSNRQSLPRRTLLAGAVGAGAAAALGGRATAAALRMSGAAEGRCPGPYEPTPGSLSQHPTARWFSDGKFGIFIHWGVYAVPHWGDDAWSSEWYLYGFNAFEKGTLHDHHRATYGADFPYDAFIPRFRAERFDPHDWVRLFERAGARYFVLTSKHHDGFQLFPNRASNRNSAAMGPKRDLVGELFGAARHTQLKRGLYYSLGEFYNPALGTPPLNPYTREPVPYTGYKPVRDYVAEYEHVHLRTLIDRYDPDVLWGDGQGTHNFDGGAGHIFRPPEWDWRSDEIMADFYNHAVNRARPKDVIMNDRFIASHADYLTVEGDKSYALQAAPWEACVTMSRSWGYMDPTSKIKTKEKLVQLLVDIVAKNGTLLLNIGPRADGTIADWQRERLLAIGAWLDVNGEAVYGSTPWSRADDGELRYTVGSDGAFHIVPLSWPGTRLTVPADLPVADGSVIRLLGHRGGPLAWRRTADAVEIDLPASGPPGAGPGYPVVLKVQREGTR
ncbi:alpha-L-fucosidase [Streptomyces sp. NBC_00144]|uniref:alpha-L-fucosidase n=1 Tax=Streptomyces sp. NBC_00144 TaxID=2975665 RepID=UPI00324A0768